MHYTSHYSSPLGEILLAAAGEGITGLWFVGQKYFAHNLDEETVEEETPLLTRARDWLDVYFSGKEPDFTPPLHFLGTPFQNEVWKILATIPYGTTMTYGQIAMILAKRRGGRCVSAQAVGGAVGRNEISLIVPCHRVVGTSGSLTGYAGGIAKKVELLTMEKAMRREFFIPAASSAF